MRQNTRTEHLDGIKMWDKPAHQSALMCFSETLASSQNHPADTTHRETTILLKHDEIRLTKPNLTVRR